MSIYTATLYMGRAKGGGRGSKMRFYLEYQKSLLQPCVDVGCLILCGLADSGECYHFGNLR